MSSPSPLTSIVVATRPFEGQKPGTSGLRKKVKVFMQKHYTENFVQSILDSIDQPSVEGETLIVGGDGRYFSKQAINIIIRIAAANHLKKLIIGKRGILSTPAVSHLIRKHEVLGGIVLTASHNPGGINNDFGIKYNCRNGGPAPDSFTNFLYGRTRAITKYCTTPDLDCDFQEIGTHHYVVDGRDFEVEVIDPAADYVELMKEIFDFPTLRKLVAFDDGRNEFQVLIDSMNGVTGPYVKEIFRRELGAEQNAVTRIIPLDNFGEIHPDPNLTYAKDLVDAVRANPKISFGAAFDGDGDRNMIIGRNAFFVTPSDSLAVIANNLQCIPYFQELGVGGFARSMPTGAAIDRVAAKLGHKMFVVPTGWKYFGNLMDAGMLSLCGEESFGTGSDHIREKDGVWAVLAWLSIIAHKKMGVEEILVEHWQEYGRNYFTRYDYEEVDADGANRMVEHLTSLIEDGSLVGREFTVDGKTFKVKLADDFSYVDPIDDSVAENQGIRIIFEDGSRLVFRLSGTGSSGATVRLYVDSYEATAITANAQEMLKPLITVALQVSKLKEFTGRDAPTVIT